LVTNGGNVGKAGQIKGSEQMNQFFSDVEIVKNSITTIKEATRKIADINQNVVQATTIEREQDHSSELKPLVDATNKRANLAKQLLQRLKEENERNAAQQQSNNIKNKSPEDRIRENMVNTLTRKFIDVMKEYQNAQTKFKTDIKKKVKRQVQIVKPDATTEEIDAVFKSGGGSGEFVKTAILTVIFEYSFVFYLSDIYCCEIL
jgi:t-SNARE complex subunit (syntaxin)